MTRCSKCDEVILPYAKTKEGDTVHLCKCTSYWPMGYDKNVKLDDLEELD